MPAAKEEALAKDEALAKEEALTYLRKIRSANMTVPPIPLQKKVSQRSEDVYDYSPTSTAALTPSTDENTTPKSQNIKPHILRPGKNNIPPMDNAAPSPPPIPISPTTRKHLTTPVTPLQYPIKKAKHCAPEYKEVTYILSEINLKGCPPIRKYDLVQLQPDKTYISQQLKLSTKEEEQYFLSVRGMTKNVQGFRSGLVVTVEKVRGRILQLLPLPRGSVKDGKGWKGKSGSGGVLRMVSEEEEVPAGYLMRIPRPVLAPMNMENGTEGNGARDNDQHSFYSRCLANDDRMLLNNMNMVKNEEEKKDRNSMVKKEESNESWLEENKHKKRHREHQRDDEGYERDRKRARFEVYDGDDGQYDANRHYRMRRGSGELLKGEKWIEQSTIYRHRR